MEVIKKFKLEEYINNKGIDVKQINITKGSLQKFKELCKDIKDKFQEDSENEKNKKGQNNEIKAQMLYDILQTQKRAIRGYEKEVNYFKSKITEYLKENKLTEEWYPNWYKNLVDGIFHENWGVAGVANWFEMEECTSAKIIGDRIYYLIGGEQVLQNQRIDKDRLNQLKKALLIDESKKRMDEEYYEVYAVNGERIAIYDEGMTKSNQATVVFRKYIINDYTWEEQAKRGTIPFSAIPMFISMINIGFNVAFLGPVRSAKTTLLQTWMKYENPRLEGILIETDPEIPAHKLLPEAPIMQILADGDKLKNIIKPLMRSDADYLVVAEARDGIALNAAVKSANKGTRRNKTTYHTTDVEDFCFDVTEEIVREYGGNLNYTMIKVAKSFNYLLKLGSLKDKSKKRLEGIYELRYDKKTREISYHQICKYRANTDSWVFKYDIGIDKEEIGEYENAEALGVFKAELKKLSGLYPMDEDNVFYPYYNKE